MECDDLIERFGDHLEQRLEPATRTELLRHLEACAKCRAATAGLDALRQRMEQERADAEAARGSAAAPPSDDPQRRRFDLLLQAWRVGAGESRADGQAAVPRPARRALQLAACAVVLLVVGIAIGDRFPWRSGARQQSIALPADAEPRFLLALRELPPSGPPPDAATLRRIVGEYSAWAGALARDGRLVVAEKLRDDGRTLLRTRDGAVEAEQALPAAGEPWLSGFFLIHARDLAQALELARGSPHLRYGGEIEVREIDRVSE